MAISRDEIRQQLRREGKTIPDWAQENGFPVRTVRAVIYGHNKGHYGQAHLVAIALGIKDKPE